MNIRISQITFLFAVFLFGCNPHSEIKKIEVAGVNNPIIPINGTWKFTMAPPEKFWENEVDFSKWSDIQVPGECQMQGFAIKHDTPYAYKTRVEIPSDYNVTPADIYFGRQKDVMSRTKEIKMETTKEMRKMNQQTKKSA